MLVVEAGWRSRIRWVGPQATESAGELVEPSIGPPLLATGASLGMGVIGALVTAGPLLLIYTGVPIELRGGAVAAGLLPGIAVVALLGNFYEEVLFRGFLQDYVQEELGIAPLRAAITSGIAFAAGHAFLASTVTDAGAALLLFTLYEGVIAGLLRMRWGLLAAVVSHGGAILLLAGGVA